MGQTVNIITVVGARPQFVKAAAVSRAFANWNRREPDRLVREKLIHTGQHYDENMSQVFFDELDIPHPDRNLEVGSGPHGVQTGIMLSRLEEVLQQAKPDWTLIYGDTNSTLAGALAAAKLHLPVAHVEAGLRSFNRRMPEEINRVLADHVCDLLFCPTETAAANLAREGITGGIHQVGDVMYDCIRYYAQKSQGQTERTLGALELRERSYCLATVHRAENTDDRRRLEAIVAALNRIADPACPVVLPLHPRTIRYVETYGLQFDPQVRVVPPVSYLSMVVLERNARVILTDSGGVQKEAYCLGVPCVTLRDETEWVETVQSGWNVLAGADCDRIEEAAARPIGRQTIPPETFYGAGDAADRICRLLVESTALARDDVTEGAGRQ